MRGEKELFGLDLVPGASCFDYNLACGEYMNYLKGEILKNVTFDWPNKFPLQPTRLFPERFLNTFRHLVSFETVTRPTSSVLIRLWQLISYRLTKSCRELLI